MDFRKADYLTILKTDNFHLQLSLQYSSLTLRLTNSVSGIKSEVYECTLTSTKDISNLNEAFSELEQLGDYIKDPNNLEINLQTKCVVVTETSKMKKKKIDIAYLPLKFVKTVSKDKNEENVEKILKMCKVNRGLSGHQIKDILQNIAIYLSENYKERKQDRQKDQQTDKRINKFESTISTQQESLSKFKKLFQNSQTVCQHNHYTIVEECRLLRQQLTQVSLKNQQMNQKIQSLAAKNNHLSETTRALLDSAITQSQGDFSRNRQLVRQRAAQKLCEQRMEAEQQKHKIEEFGYKINKRSQTQEKNQKMESLLSQEQVDMNTKYSSKFAVARKNNTTTVKYIGQYGNYTNYFFADRIQYGQVLSFKIRLVKTLNSDIMLGIVDHTKQKQSRYSYVSNNAIAYWGCNGTKYPGGQSESNGFSCGETVEVIVNRINYTVRWIVNGQHRAYLAHQMLADQQRLFVPYVELQNIDDTVEYIV